MGNYLRSGRRKLHDMDISGTSALVTGVNQADTANAVQLTVQKKAIDVNAQSALQLIQAASNIIPSNPSHLGTQIDAYAWLFSHYALKSNDSSCARYSYLWGGF